MLVELATSLVFFLFCFVKLFSLQRKSFTKQIIFILEKPINLHLLLEYTIKNLYKIRKVDINIIENLFKEIKQEDSQEYRNLNLNNYLILFEKVWKNGE